MAGAKNVGRTVEQYGLVGARVHVGFEVISSCAGKPAGTCFQGTIRSCQVLRIKQTALRMLSSLMEWKK